MTIACLHLFFIFGRCFPKAFQCHARVPEGRPWRAERRARGAGDRLKSVPMPDRSTKAQPTGVLWECKSGKDWLLRMANTSLDDAHSRKCGQTIDFKAVIQASCSSSCRPRPYRTKRDFKLSRRSPLSQHGDPTWKRIRVQCQAFRDLPEEHADEPQFTNEQLFK